jgi:hypothetical protein
MRVAWTNYKVMWCLDRSSNLRPQAWSGQSALLVLTLSIRAAPLYLLEPFGWRLQTFASRRRRRRRKTVLKALTSYAHPSRWRVSTNSKRCTIDWSYFEAPTPAPPLPSLPLVYDDLLLNPARTPRNRSMTYYYSTSRISDQWIHTRIRNQIIYYRAVTFSSTSIHNVSQRGASQILLKCRSNLDDVLNFSILPVVP